MITCVMFGWLTYAHAMILCDPSPVPDGDCYYDESLNAFACAWDGRMTYRGHEIETIPYLPFQPHVITSK